jgi:glucose-1-phosphate cytidylyltransferase
MTVTSYPLQSPFGILEINEEGRTVAFAEKPTLDKWINIGYFYFSKEASQLIKRHKTFIELLHDGIERGDLYSFRHKGVHITVNTIKELHDAEKNIGTLNRATERHRNDSF